MKPLAVAICTCALATLSGLNAGAPAEPVPDELPRGVVVAKVVCRADATQSYALYLPSNYDPARAWPVLLCFDPGGRGRVPVELFRAAAEQFGYVVAGSNNARNGPWADNFKAIEALLRDTGARLSLDIRRRYTAGFSGGARAATGVAAAGLAQGVIACSGAFAGGETPARVPFAFFGTAGVDDFNFPEMLRTDRELDARGAPHRVAFFAGGHDWPPPDLAREAVEWLELQAMRAGTRTRDAGFIHAVRARRRAAAAALPPAEAWREYESLARDFLGLVDTADEARRAAEMRRSREVRAWRRQEDASGQRQLELEDELFALAREDWVSRLRETVAARRREAEAMEDSADRRLARRVLQGASIAAVEQAPGLLAQKDYEEAAGCLELAVAVHPEWSRTHYDLARARALLGDRRAALAALQAAVAAGFEDAARAAQEPAFAGLRSESSFQEVLAGLRK